jgi:hypothetical protein
MDRKIATGVGIVAALMIHVLNLIWLKMHVVQSPLNQLQFLLVLLAMVVSSFLLRRYYADISLFDNFKHCLRTLSTLLFLVIVGNVIIYFIFRKPNDPWAAMTLMIMKTIFAFSMSGALSAFVTSFIFNTFTRKK